MSVFHSLREGFWCRWITSKIFCEFSYFNYQKYSFQNFLRKFFNRWHKNKQGMYKSFFKQKYSFVERWEAAYILCCHVVKTIIKCKTVITSLLWLPFVIKDFFFIKIPILSRGKIFAEISLPLCIYLNHLLVRRRYQRIRVSVFSDNFLSNLSFIIIGYIQQTTYRTRTQIKKQWNKFTQRENCKKKIVKILLHLWNTCPTGCFKIKCTDFITWSNIRNQCKSLI